MIKTILILYSVVALIYTDHDHPPPKIQINTLYSADIATQDLITFRKVDAHGWTSIISAYPIAKKKTTKISIKLITGNTSFLGCGIKQKDLLRTQYFGQMPDTVGYYTPNGQKYIRGDSIDYGVISTVGDIVTMIINLHQGQQWVQFVRNGNSMGKAFGGLGDWPEIYIGISLYYAGQTIKIIGYEVIQ